MMKSNSIIIIVIFNLLSNINLLVRHIIQRFKTKPESAVKYSPNRPFNNLADGRMPMVLERLCEAFNLPLPSSAT